MNVHQVKSSSKLTADVQHLTYESLDIVHSLRGFCALYVVVFHAKFILWSGGTSYLAAYPIKDWAILDYIAFAADMASSAGYEMVIFFFVLSGFFIRYAQLKKHRPAGKFYLNRVVRIYPPYVASLVLSGVILAYLANSHPNLLNFSIGRELNAGLLVAWKEIHPLTFEVLSYAMLFMKVGINYFGYNNVYWSLLPEALFYLLVPVVVRKPMLYYGLSLIGYIMGALWPEALMAWGAVSKFLLMYNAYFALGMAFYDVVTRHYAWLQRFRVANGWWLAMGIIALLSLLVLTAALQFSAVSGPLAAVLAVLCISTLLAGRVSRQNWLIKVFHEIGVFSFSLYLYHFPLLILCYAGLVSYTHQLVNYQRYYWLLFPLVTVGCYVLYYITERQAIRYFRGV